MPKALKEKRLFQIWLTPEQYEKLKGTAYQCGLSMSEYVRTLIDDIIPRQAPTGDFIRILGELKAIGNNMNQIAYLANSTHIIDRDNYHENYQKLIAIIRELERAAYNGNA